MMRTDRTLSIGEVADRFPAFRVAAVTVEDLAIPPERPPPLASLVAEREEAARARFGGMELSAIPGIAAWRAAYKGFGIKRTSYRSSVERLVKNVLAGRPLPGINGFVDAYNAVSLTHVLCLGADDLDRVTGDLAFRVARAGDSFVDMGAEEGEDPHDPPKEGEVVYADAEKVLCRRWNWRQDARSVITPETRRAVVTVQSNGAGDVEAAARDLVALVGRFCGGRATVVVADGTRPSVSLG
jgi:DNA/RNA-binding domain of Phe-tRNA-synthetase-like protein